MNVKRFVGFGLVMLLIACFTQSVSAAIAFKSFSNDIESGISSSNTYLKAVNLGPSLSSPPFPAWTGTTINGVLFYDGSVNGPGYTTTGSTAGFNATTAITATNGLPKLYSRYFTAGSTGVEEITVTGLTLNTSYDFRVYTSSTDISGSVPVTVRGTNGSTVENAAYDPFARSGWQYVEFEFTATASSATLAFIPSSPPTIPGNSLAVYGFTVQVVPEPVFAGFAIGLCFIALSRPGPSIRRMLSGN